MTDIISYFSFLFSERANFILKFKLIIHDSAQ